MIVEYAIFYGLLLLLMLYTLALISSR